MQRTPSLLVLLALLPCTCALAAETVPPVSDTDPGCACVAKGKRFAQGESACVNGLRMTCGMNQNVTAWLSSGEQCNISLRGGSAGPGFKRVWTRTVDAKIPLAVFQTPL